jgi:hypothetical protein
MKTSLTIILTILFCSPFMFFPNIFGFVNTVAIQAVESSSCYSPSIEKKGLKKEFDKTENKPSINFIQKIPNTGNVFGNLTLANFQSSKPNKVLPISYSIGTTKYLNPLMKIPNTGNVLEKLTTASLLLIEPIKTMPVSYEIEPAEYLNLPAVEEVVSVKQEESIEEKQKNIKDLLNKIQTEFVKDVKEESFERLTLKWKESVDLALPKIKAKYGNTIDLYARAHEVSDQLIISVIAIESHGRVNVKGPRIGHSLGGVSKIAQKDVGIKGDLYDSRVNIEITAAYLKKIMKDYFPSSGVAKSVFAYNLGSGKVRRLTRNGELEDWEINSSDYVTKIAYAIKLQQGEISS